MKRKRWQRMLSAAVTVAGLATGRVWAEDTPIQGGAVIVLREPGKAERRCVIEKTIPLADGSIIHEVRDESTGEKMRILDNRTKRGVAGQVLAKVTGPNSVGIATAVMGAKANEPKPPPTPAELAAGYSGPPAATATESRPGILPRLGLLRRPKPAPVAESVPGQSVVAQMQKLKEGLAPSEREMAAMTLTLCDARTHPEVVTALVNAAKSDPAPTVRNALVLCLYRLSGDAPQVVPTILEMQADVNEDVRATAKQAAEELASKSGEPALKK